MNKIYDTLTFVEESIRNTYTESRLRTMLEELDIIRKHIIEQEDKLSRRNMQIKDLKTLNHKLTIEINQLYRDIEKAKK